MRSLPLLALAALAVGAPTVRASAQLTAAAQAAAAAPAPPPATKLEAFRPTAGTIVTLGYNPLGQVRGLTLDVREYRDARGTIVVRGLVAQVYESEYRQERSFIDADEIPELLRGIDALLAVRANPTIFEQFEVRYRTKGDFELTAFNSKDVGITYSAAAGRVMRASTFNLDAQDLQKLRGMIETAQGKLYRPAAVRD